MLWLQQMTYHSHSWIYRQIKGKQNILFVLRKYDKHLRSTVKPFSRLENSSFFRYLLPSPNNSNVNVNTDPNWQVKTFTDTFLSIMSNFVPNETKRFVPRNPPWITKPMKTMLNRKNRLYNNYKSHGYKAEDKVRIDAFRIECQQAVETAKYLI